MTDNVFHLTIQSGLGAGQNHVLSGPSLTIGRYPLAEIVIDDPDVSYRHALLTRGGDTYRIADLGSDAGTYVNGRRIGAEPVALAPGDIVLLGAHISAAFLTSATEPAIEAAPASLPPVLESEVEPVVESARDEPERELWPPAPPRLPIHDQPLPEMPPPQKNNNRRIALILAGCLALLGCCCGTTLFMYFIGGDWLLNQLRLLP
jgi:hypothetical protein